MKHQFKYFGLVVGLIFLIVSSSFSQTFKFSPEYSTSISAEKAPDILRQCSRSVPGKVNGYFDLTVDDIHRLEADFKKVLSVDPQGCCYSGKIQNLKKHAFQYAGLIIKKKKYIYVNAFYLEHKEDLERFHKDWKTKPVIFCDGGEYFWGVLYDIKKGKFSKLSMNGVS